jgi:acyl-CoA thioesterase-1
MRSTRQALLLTSLALLLAAGVAGCKTAKSTKFASQMDAQASPQPVEAPDAPAPHEAAGQHDSRLVIVCFGDSLTAGYGADEGKSYPDFLQQALDRQGFHYRVVNEGVSGDTSKDGVDRLSEVIALRPAVVVLEFGGNDGLRGVNVKTTRANLAKMIEALQKAGAKIVLAGIILPPDYGQDYVNSFVANYTSLAKQYDLPLLPFLLKDVYGVPGMMQQDNIHATDRGNEIVAHNVLPLVEPLLRK